VAGRRDKVQEDVRFRVLRLLEENPEMSQRNLATAVGISLGSLHYCLNALIEKGLVMIGNFTAAEDKRRYAYVLTPKGVIEKATLTHRFLKRKRAEYQALKSEIEALQEELELGADMKPSPSGKSTKTHWGP
jgi:EPS-associated MarR family transcriptional regulator